MRACYRHTNAIQRICSTYELVNAIQKSREYSWAFILTRKVKTQLESNIEFKLDTRDRIELDKIRLVLSWNSLFVDVLSSITFENTIVFNERKIVLILEYFKIYYHDNNNHFKKDFIKWLSEHKIRQIFTFVSHFASIKLIKRYNHLILKFIVSFYNIIKISFLIKIHFCRKLSTLLIHEWFEFLIFFSLNFFLNFNSNTLQMTIFMSSCYDKKSSRRK